MSPPIIENDTFTEEQEEKNSRRKVIVWLLHHVRYCFIVSHECWQEFFANFKINSIKSICHCTLTYHRSSESKQFSEVDIFSQNCALSRSEYFPVELRASIAPRLITIDCINWVVSPYSAALLQLYYFITRPCDVSSSTLVACTCDYEWYQSIVMMILYSFFRIARWRIVLEDFPGYNNPSLGRIFCWVCVIKSLQLNVVSSLFGYALFGTIVFSMFKNKIIETYKVLVQEIILESCIFTSEQYPSHPHIRFHHGSPRN